MKCISIFLLFWLVGLPLTAGPWQGFTSLAISPDGRWFATGGREGELIWFETETGEPRGRWTMAGRKPVIALAFDSDNSHLQAMDLSGLVVAVSPGNPMRTVPPGPEITSKTADVVSQWLSASPLVSGVRATWGDLWAQGGPDGTITVGSLSRGRPVANWPAHDAAVTGLAFSADGFLLLSASYDGTLRLWDPQTGQPRGSL